jgi:glyoxylase-like metal-dependent hydrolase (beta-lactamase superfamily II)
MEGPTELAPGVYGLGSDIVNWYLVEEDGRLTAVDAGLPAFAASLDTDLDTIGFSVSDIEAVVLTHSDGDHIGIARELETRGARVLIHEDDEETLPKGGPRGGGRSPRHLLPNLWRPAILRILGHSLRRGGAKLPKVENARTFSSDEVLEVPGRPRVVPTPGHTPGHCALLFESRGTLIAGDALCNHELITHGRGPRLMPSFLNVDNRAAHESLTAIEQLTADLLLFGHGGPWREGTRSAVESAREAGGS